MRGAPLLERSTPAPHAPRLGPQLHSSLGSDPLAIDGQDSSKGVTRGDKWLTGNSRRAYDATDIDPALRQLRRWQHAGTDRASSVIRLRSVFGREIA